MRDSALSLPVDPEPIPTLPVLGLGTAVSVVPGCAEGGLPTHTARPACMNDGSDPLGDAPRTRHGAYLVGTVWERAATALAAGQRLVVPLYAGTRDVAHTAGAAAFTRRSDPLLAPDSAWHEARRVDLYAMPGTFVLWGVERPTVGDEAPGAANHLVGIYVTDDGPLQLTAPTMHTLLLHVASAHLSEGGRALFTNTLDGLSTRPVVTQTTPELPEVTEALEIFCALHPRPSRVRPADARDTALVSALPLLSGCFVEG
ncbi:MAG: hypothetical protein H3C62_01325 [Gemmatimonadaceae bacterium]|nr:hypothetical protein [Gemmatimonadaceae bacterium]